MLPALVQSNHRQTSVVVALSTERQNPFSWLDTLPILNKSDVAEIVTYNVVISPQIPVTSLGSALVLLCSPN